MPHKLIGYCVLRHTWEHTHSRPPPTHKVKMTGMEECSVNVQSTHTHTHTRWEPQKQERKHTKSGRRKLLWSCRAAPDGFRSVRVG